MEQSVLDILGEGLGPREECGEVGESIHKLWDLVHDKAPELTATAETMVDVIEKTFTKEQLEPCKLGLERLRKNQASRQ